MSQRRSIQKHVPERSASPLRRGRPSLQIKRKVADDILAAVRKCLETDNVSEITLRDIAAAAGTTEPMIQYYYGGRTGLLYAVVQESTKLTIDRLRAATKDMLSDPESATRKFVSFILTNNRTELPAIKVLISELARDDSLIKRTSVEKWSVEAGQAFMETIAAFVDAGVYRKDIDIERMASMLNITMLYPLLHQDKASSGLSLKHVGGEDSVEFLTQLFERYART